MRSICFILLASILLTGCLKAEIAPSPIVPSTSEKNAAAANTTAKTDTLKNVSYSPDTDTSNPDYWFNGTKGTAIVQVTCKDCDAIATIGVTTVPFIFNAAGVGVLKYTPITGLPIQIAVCPGSAKSIKAEILDNKNAALYSYAGVITSNWSGSYTIK
ncbi:MAG: hypothetical protein EOP47_16145 [Sphingobacteriaceae bacterium]|nr:MAG: hypothetical protein EOP47_16145 [Sphingobacteriaceae bacterium]